MLVKYASLFLLLGFTLNSQAQETEEIDRFQKVDLDKVLETAKSFSSSKTTDELLKWVRDPERVKPLINSYYERNELPMVGITEVHSTRGTINKDLISIPAKLKDFSAKTLTFQDGTDGYKIDWESWVGYSELSWENFMEKKPKDPLLFRVALKSSNYYNFEFADDKKWANYNLLSPDKEHTLEGYAQVGSAAHKQLREINFDVPADPNEFLYSQAKSKKSEQAAAFERATPSTKHFIVKLRFLPNSRSNKMVVIDEVIQQGWAFLPKSKEEE